MREIADFNTVILRFQLFSEVIRLKRLNTQSAAFSG